MGGKLFGGRIGAMAFAGCTILAAATLVGTGEDEGIVAQAADEIVASPEASAPEVAPMPETPESFDMSDDVAFASDEDLVDDAEGFDPTPMTETPDPVLLETDSAGDGIDTVAEPGADDTLVVDERRYEILK